MLIKTTASKLRAGTFDLSILITRLNSSSARFRSLLFRATSAPLKFLVIVDILTNSHSQTTTHSWPQSQLMLCRAEAGPLRVILVQKTSSFCASIAIQVQRDQKLPLPTPSTTHPR